MAMVQRVTSRLMQFRALALAAFIPILAGPAWAGTLSGGAGFDYQTGPHAQSYRGALLFASAERDAGDLTLAAIRYGDSRVGPGTGAFANGSAAITPHVRVRGVGLRAIGDESYRAWRWRLGPEIRFGSNLTLGAYYLRITDNAGGRVGSAGLELGGPVSRNVTGQVGSTYGKWNGDVTTAQGSLSGTWQALSHVLLLAELDVGRNITTTATAGPSGGGGGLGGIPLPGGLGGKGNARRGETQSSSEIATAGQIGVRFLIP